MLVDTGFHVTEASPACATLLGVRPDSLIGRHLLDAIADDGLRMLCSAA